MHVPAFCGTCGAVFRSGIVVEKFTDETPAGNSGAPCPVCGRMGNVPGGVFNFLGNTIEILSAPQRTTDELTRLVEILSEASEKRESPDVIVEVINGELPGLSGLADLLPKTRAGLNSYISMTVAVSVLIWQTRTDADGARNITVEQALNHIFNQTNISAESLGPQLRSRVRRNESCPCGSGRKYKRCCGQLP